MKPNIASFQFLLILAVLLSALAGTPALAQSGTIVRVDPASRTAQLNETMNISINIDSVANLTGMEIHLSFNPAVLEVTQLSNGGFIAPDIVPSSLFDNSAGTIDYGIQQLNTRPAAQGSGTVLTIGFRAKAAGSSNIALRATAAAPSGLLLADQNGSAIAATWSGGTISVGAPVTATATSPSAVTSTPAPVTATPSFTPTSTLPVSVTPITATPTMTPITPPAGMLGVHTVRLGESLYCIGRAYKVSPWAIASTNKLWWPYVIFPYQKLNIPNVPWTSIPSGPTCPAQFSTTNPPMPIVTVTPTATPPSTCRAYYVVRAGDTLYRISVSFGVPYQDIARVNKITNSNYIYIGQRLCIP